MRAAISGRRGRFVVFQLTPQVPILHLTVGQLRFCFWHLGVLGVEVFIKALGRGAWGLCRVSCHS